MTSLVGKRVRVKYPLEKNLGVGVGDSGVVSSNTGILRVRLDSGWETLLWPDEVEPIEEDEG